MTGPFIVDVVATLVGIFVGTLAALAVDRYNERRSNRRRARIILRSLHRELAENDQTLRAVRPAYKRTDWGKSFYVGTIAWETALSSGDLPEIIGFDLADGIGAQYAHLVRIRYYVDLLTRLWFAPSEIEGHDEIRKGFSQNIVASMNRAISDYPEIAGQIERALRGG